MSWFDLTNLLEAINLNFFFQFLWYPVFYVKFCMVSDSGRHEVYPPKLKPRSVVFVSVCCFCESYGYMIGFFNLIVRENENLKDLPILTF